MPDANLIYDVGAHKGEDTELYLKKGFRVVAIEAVPEFCADLHQRFPQQIRDGQLDVLNLAVASKSGAIDFYINEKISVWGTANLDWIRRNGTLAAGHTRKITIEARPLIDIVGQYGVPWYCKIDIEGNDFDALRSLNGSTEQPQYISIEAEKRSWGDLINELLTFRELGYSRYKIVDQSLVQYQTCPFPAREGNYCEHTFEWDSSGLFGEEIPGTWLSFPEAVEAYRNIFRGYALNGDNGMFSKHRFSLFQALGHIQAKLARFRNHSEYLNPANILPPAVWYDTHAAR